MLGRLQRLFGLGLLCWLVVVAQAQAQTAPARKAAAEALFDRGLTLMREGKYAQACKQLEQSQAIETGIGTMLYLAECYELSGRTASAWALFREAASAAREEGQGDRHRTAESRAAALEPKLARLSVQVAPEQRVQGMTISINNVDLAAGAWGVPVPVDPGDCRIEVNAPGYLVWSTVQPVAEGETRSLVVPPLQPDPSPPSVAAEAPAPVEQAAGSPADPGGAELSTPAMSSAPGPDHPTGWQAQRPVGLGLGVTGLVAMGIGTYFGLRAISKDNEADELCPGSASACASEQGVERAEQANSAASLSNVFVFGGAAVLAAGVILYLTAPAKVSTTQVALSGGPGGARLTLRGTF